ncbi:uncharacterized protein [Nicotiana sylvestris]|uniref:uncharacterized protein n=1 Tax=Nicotiana sylvestris TaxID=4096 RepID=UPI00388C8825
MDTFYNFLLGRPWIHVAGAVPSTLYQMVKFEHENQEIVDHEEDEQSTYSDPSVPCLEAREGSEHIVNQDFEIVVADQCEEGTPCPQPCLSNTSIMVSIKMIKHGYKPGKGLGVSLRGTIEPITLTIGEKFFGVCFQAIEVDVNWDSKRKKYGRALPQQVSHLSRTFVRPSSNDADLNNMTCLRTSCPDPNTLCNCKIMNQEPEYDKDKAFRKINRELEQLENKPKPNLNETKPVNLGSPEEVQETMISIHDDERTRDPLIQLLFEFKDVFNWSYDNMLGLSVDLVVHKLPTYLGYPPVQQKQRKFKTDISDKIKEEVLMDEEDAKRRLSPHPGALTIIGSCRLDDHVRDLRKFFERLCKYDLKLNLAKCAFGVPSGKHLGFIVSRRGIELDPTKIKSIRDSPPSRTKKEVMSLLGRLNYISRFIAQLTTTCKPIFKLLKKDAAIRYTGRLAKWQILLTEFDIVYVTRTMMKAQALADHLAENPVDDEYQPLSTYFPDEEVNSVELISENTHAWKMLFDRGVNAKGVGIRVILISPTGQHYLAPARLQFFCTNNTVEYEACIMGMNMAVDLDVEELLIMGDSDLII